MDQIRAFAWKGVRRSRQLAVGWRQGAMDWIVGNILRRADRYYLCSYPKSGRTWVRYFLADYMASVYGLGVDIDLRNLFTILPNDDRDDELRGLPAYAYAGRPEIPLILATHVDYDARYFARKNILFVVRGAGDTLVSFYFHQSKHAPAYGWDPFEGDLSQFIRDERRGAVKLFRYLKNWSAGLETARRFHVVKYEDLHRDPAAKFRNVITFLGLPLDETQLKASVSASRFDQMRARERSRGLPGLQGDVVEEDALRIRRGVVGGYKDYLSEEDIDYIRDVRNRYMSAGYGRGTETLFAL